MRSGRLDAQSLKLKQILNRITNLEATTDLPLRKMAVIGWASAIFKTMFNQNQIPTRGYKVPQGYGSGYRATAIAYLQREGLFTVGHINGNYYTLSQLLSTRIG